MKRFIALFLTLVMLLPLAACSSEKLGGEEANTAEQTATAPATTSDPTPETEPVQSGPVQSAISTEVATTPLNPGDLLTWGHINAIPVAKQGMSENQLRQIVWDFMELTLAFRWVPNSSFKLPTSRTGNTRPYDAGLAYGGMPYTAGSYNNPYMVMQYYNSETGAINTAAMGENPGEKIGSMCISSTLWAWRRVTNTTRFGGINYVVPSRGIIVLGSRLNAVMQAAPFNNPSVYEGETATLNIVEKAGKSAMNEAYSQLKLADGLVTSNHNHIVMVHHVDVAAQKIYIQHQAPGGRTPETGAAGVEYLPAPGRSAEWTFDYAYENGYIPFTIPEFVGQDPVEDATVTFSFTGEKISTMQILASKMKANYAISDVYVQIFDGDTLLMEEQYSLNSVEQFGGQCTMKELYMVSSDASVSAGVSMTKFTPFKGKGYTVKLLARVSTGEVLEAYSGTLA